MYSMFGVFEGLFGIAFVIFIIFFVFVLVKGISQWSRNNAQPQIPAEARVLSKRRDVSHHDDGNGVMHTDERYYATFEYINGERVELTLKRSDYGLIVEGDQGILTTQGTRFIGFERRG